MSYTLAWKDILSISEDFFESYEFDHISWDDWPTIERFIKDSYEQVRMSTTARPRSNSAPPAVAGARLPEQRKMPEHANGVPVSFMKDQYICCGFNLGFCKVQSGGDHKIGNTTLHHWCGGCFKKYNGKKDPHPADGCKNGPFGSLFA